MSDAIRKPPRPAKPVLAHSLRDAKQHELILADGRGRIISRRRLVLTWSGLGAAGVATVAALFWLDPIIGVGALIGVGWSVYLQRRTRTLNSIIALVDRGQLDEARALIAEFPTSRLPKALRPCITTLAGRVSLRQGNLDEAIAYYAKAIELFETTRRYERNLWYWLTRFELCGTLARAGHIPEAATARPLAERLPSGEMYAVYQCATDLGLAFYADDDQFLPDEGTLHEQGKLALGSNVLGSLLVLIAWACERSGDDDLANHWLAESQSRLDRLKLEQCAPEILAWMDARLVSFGIRSP